MATNNSLAKQNGKVLKNYIKIYEGEIAKALPKVMTPERFARIATSAVSNNEKLQECEPITFISALMQSAQLGLEPNTPLGEAYLIPYGKQCQFQIGYRGMISLARRSKEIKNISAHVVYENDEFDYEYGLNPDLKHKPTKSNRGKPIYYYATFHLVNGGFGFEVMSYEDCVEHGKKFSKTYNNGPWKTDFDSMALKTVLKKALKYAPLKSDFAMAIESDETVKSHISEDMLRVPNDTLEAEFEVKEEVSQTKTQPKQEGNPTLL